MSRTNRINPRSVPRCAICGEPLLREGNVCPDCGTHLETVAVPMHVAPRVVYRPMERIGMQTIDFVMGRLAR